MSIPSSQPLITTVIPTYRRPAMLRRAIRSVLNQTLPHFRLCVYDNASGDDTGAVVEEFQREDSRVEYLCRPTNIGMDGNFIDGANRVETPFFSFLSDDDLLLPNFYEDALKGFQRHPEAALSILPTLCMTPRGLIFLVTGLQWPEGLVQPPQGMLSTLYHGNPGLQGMLIRKDVWDEFGGFDCATEPTAEYDFDLRVMARLPVVVCKKPGAIQVVHSGAFTSETGLRFVWPCVPRIISKLTQNMDLQPEIRKQAVETMTRWLRQGLLRLGVVKSIGHAKWEDAERAADLLIQEFPQWRPARTIRRVGEICRRFPVSRFFARALLALRDIRNILRNAAVQWQFQGYARFLRTSTVVAASKMNSASPVRRVSEYDGGAHPLRDSASARKIFS